MEICPVTLQTAREFVREHHRHNSPPQGHKFSIGLTDGERLIGVVIVGRPIARFQDNGFTAEITRCCVLDNIKNANSKLYAAAIRAARDMGYIRIITYTLPTESGASLRAAGFEQDGITKYSSWNTAKRERKMPEKYPVGEKIRWVKILRNKN